MIKKILILVTVIFLGAGAAQPSACQNTPATVPPPPQQVDAPINLETDSIGFQYFMAGGANDWPGANIKSWPGGTINICPQAGCVNATADLNAQKAAGLARRNFIELSTNDAHDGWTKSDTDAWSTVLGNMPADSCTVVVLPWVTDPQPQTWKDSIDAARAWMLQVDNALSQVVTIDWRDYAVLGPDGIHLPGPGGVAYDGANLQVSVEAMTAYRSMITAGLARCPG